MDNTKVVLISLKQIPPVPSLNSGAFTISSVNRLEYYLTDFEESDNVHISTICRDGPELLGF